MIFLYCDNVLDSNMVKVNLGDPQVSGLPENANLKDFYSNFKTQHE